MRLSELFLQGYDINIKNIRPATVLDILDSMLTTVSIEQATKDIQARYNLSYNGNAQELEFISKDPILVQLLNTPRATKLYLRILTNIILGTGVDLNKEDINSIFGDISNNSRYRGLSKAVDNINAVLKDAVIVYSQYADRVSIIVVKGTTEQEYKDSLAKSGYQSPIMLDKLHTTLITKGII